MTHASPSKAYGCGIGNRKCAGGKLLALVAAIPFCVSVAAAPQDRMMLNHVYTTVQRTLIADEYHAPDFLPTVWQVGAVACCIAAAVALVTAITVTSSPTPAPPLTGSAAQKFGSATHTPPANQTLAATKVVVVAKVVELESVETAFDHAQVGWDSVVAASEGIDWDCVRKASQEARRIRKNSSSTTSSTPFA
jgi:hypothetical protein